MIVEILIFLIAGVGALFITGFSVHMLTGGLISPELENQVIFIVCSIVFCIIAYMAWDVIQRRTGKK